MSETDLHKKMRILIHNVSSTPIKFVETTEKRTMLIPKIEDCNDIDFEGKGRRYLHKIYDYPI